jgi:hypothetical protein
MVVVTLERNGVVWHSNPIYIEKRISFPIAYGESFHLCARTHASQSDQFIKLSPTRNTTHNCLNKHLNLPMNSIFPNSDLKEPSMAPPLPGSHHHVTILPRHAQRHLLGKSPCLLGTHCFIPASR